MYMIRCILFPLLCVTLAPILWPCALKAHQVNSCRGGRLRGPFLEKTHDISESLFKIEIEGVPAGHLEDRGLLMKKIGS